LHADWKAVAREAGFRVAHDNSITIDLDGGSTQKVTLGLDAAGQCLYASSVIAGPRTFENAAGGAENVWQYAWTRNRLSDLLGFTIDRHGRLIGETWMPLTALTAEEFRIYVTELARVSDWHEFRLTGLNTY
jgi:hypothetical protein